MARRVTRVPRSMRHATRSNQHNQPTARHPSPVTRHPERVYNSSMPERLWAPWRLTYIEKAASANSEEGCIFVDLPASADDRKNLILFRGTTAFVMLNAFPYTNGHLMVAPDKHTADMGEL